MASNQSFVDYVVEQIENAGNISYRKMFGEYALYCDSKVVALICDDRLFVKPTDEARAYIGNVIEGSPYPGAKPYFLIKEGMDDRNWLSGLIKITAEALPNPKPKKTKSKRSGSSKK
jgi:TfoX/Sxy family transcriptional regulator of competence genes